MLPVLALASVMMPGCGLNQVRRKSVLTKSTLPGKLADCTTTDKGRSEIFVVEGDSAGA